MAIPQRRSSRMPEVDVTGVTGQRSSGSTVRNDDVDMVDDSNGIHTNGSNTDSEVNGRFAQETTSTFAELPRRLINVIQKLGALDIDNTLPSLPKIVVVGDQSHGKSSIIEAVCDIALPRSEGTCTRCPFEITTTGCTDGPWTCKISLIRKATYNPKGARNTNSANRWQRAEFPDIVEFATVTDKSLLDHALRLAQLAILSPRVDPQDVLQRSDTTLEPEIGFSPNIISLKIASPNLPELSLIDLPGAINVTANIDDSHLVGFIEKMIKNYVKDEKALVLLAVSANADTNTSTAFKFVHQGNALHRCMGVLTKPDTVVMNRNQIQHVQGLLDNSNFKLGSNGWFVTKQPSQEELDRGVTRQEARNREEAFFGREPWSTALSTFAPRFGVPHLQDALSKKLTEHILGELPEMNARVEKRLEEVTSQLRAFPEPAAAPCLTVMKEIDDLTTVIAQKLRGDALTNNFRDEYKKILQGLREQLKASRPRLILTTPGFKPPPICVDSDDNDDISSASPAPTPSKKRKGDNGQSFVTPSRTPSTPIKIEEGAAPAVAPMVFRLNEVKIAYDSGSSSGLPEEVNPKVTEDLALQCLRGWGVLANSTLEKIQELLVGMLAKSVEDTWASRRGTRLFDDATEAIEELFLGFMQTRRTTIAELIADETYKPITYGDVVFRQAKESAKGELLENRASQRVKEHFDKLDAKQASNKIMKPEERKKKAADSAFLSTLGADPYAREINAMRTPIAYYTVASNRFMDNIALSLDRCLLGALEQGLKEKLQKSLDVLNPEHCADLLQEDPQREADRQALLAEKTNLLQAMEELQGLPHLN
ncbi:hypothetical protein LTR37_011918 [Vermiconidia calcicola]|uniref:Uncharacterized protein n=1 Tax=Vermiconidia calcicola TaxID=1690605 RepID=A0ACC3N3J2_9PEZI|nr:hypothetical protein LTR37_011918 [Vermiconidia calcicola]